MATTLKYRFALRRRTAAGWAANNEVLLQSEWGHESDTGKLKLGDGETPWNTLPYHNTDNVPEGATNQYFTPQRVSAALAPGDGIGITYAGGVNTISLAGLPIYLVDESGNQLTDESGTPLVDTATTSLPVEFSVITNTPTTLTGYGITDAQRVGDPVKHPAYTLSSLPDPSTFVDCIVVCTDLSEGRAPVYSNGVNWLRFTNNTVAN